MTTLAFIIIFLLAWFCIGLIAAIVALKKEVMFLHEPEFGMFICMFMAIGLIGFVLILFEKKI